MLLLPDTMKEISISMIRGLMMVMITKEVHLRKRPKWLKIVF